MAIGDRERVKVGKLKYADLLKLIPTLSAADSLKAYQIQRQLQKEKALETLPETTLQLRRGEQVTPADSLKVERFGTAGEKRLLARDKVEVPTLQDTLAYEKALATQRFRKGGEQVLTGEEKRTLGIKPKKPGEVKEETLKTAVGIKTLENKLNELKLTDLGVTKKLQSSTIKEFTDLVKSNMKSSITKEEGVFDITKIDPIIQKEFEVSTLSFMHDLAKTEEKRNAIEGLLLGLLDEAFERDVVDRFTSFDEAVSAYKQWLTEIK